MGNTLKLEDLLKPDCLPDESAGGENWRILHPGCPDPESTAAKGDFRCR